MRYLVFGICLLLATPAYCGVPLTDDQFDNLSVISQHLEGRYASYKGHNGSNDNMEFIGISDLQASAELNSININNLKSNDPDRKMKRIYGRS